MASGSAWFEATPPGQGGRRQKQALGHRAGNCGARPLQRTQNLAASSRRPLDETAAASNVPAGRRIATLSKELVEFVPVTKLGGSPMPRCTLRFVGRRCHRCARQHLKRYTTRATVATVDLARATVDPEVNAQWPRLRLRRDVLSVVNGIKGEVWWACPSEFFAVLRSGGQQARGVDPWLSTMCLWLTCAPRNVFKSGRSVLHRN